MAGCTDTTSRGVNPNAEKQLPQEILAEMKAKGMTRSSPVMARIFKEEGKLEIWKQTNNGRYDLIAGYDICKWSGQLGPKFTEGDRQAPEGFYAVRPAQMNQWSNYHLAFLKADISNVRPAVVVAPTKPVRRISLKVISSMVWRLVTGCPTWWCAKLPTKHCNGLRSVNHRGMVYVRRCVRSM